jgi:hypothetical protein
VGSSSWRGCLVLAAVRGDRSLRCTVIALSVTVTPLFVSYFRSDTPCPLPSFFCANACIIYTGFFPIIYLIE